MNVPVAESYLSAEANDPAPVAWPPATRTLPSGSNVAVWPSRAIFIDPVAMNWVVSGVDVAEVVGDSAVAVVGVEDSTRLGAADVARVALGAKLSEGRGLSLLVCGNTITPTSATTRIAITPPAPSRARTEAVGHRRAETMAATAIPAITISAATSG